MEIITSPQNQKILEAKKLQQKKYREAQGQFITEGLRLTEEALKKGQVVQVFYHESLLSTERGIQLLKGLSAQTKQIDQVSTRALLAICETETPQGIVAIVRKTAVQLDDLKPQGKGPLVLLDGLQEPGNLGGILRTLWAVGGEGLLCLEGTTDPYNSKAVRASMGGVFSVPIVQNLYWPQIKLWAENLGYMIIAGDIHQAIDYRQIQWQAKTLLCIGNESRGLIHIPSEEKIIRVKLPLKNQAESLNAAVAAGILLYEAVRNQ